MRDEGGVWALHNRLLWPGRPNEPEMKELRGSLEDASLLRYFSHCSAGTAQCPPWPGRPSPNPQRGQPGLDLVVGGAVLVLQVLCCFSGLEKPNRQRRLYPRRNRTVNFVNSSRSIQHHHHPAPPAPCPTAHTHTLTYSLSPPGPPAAAGWWRRAARRC